MKLSTVLIFVGIALMYYAQRSECYNDDDFDVSIEQCDGGGFCPPSYDKLNYNECCRYFKDTCCTHEQNQKLKTIFIVVVVASVLSFIALIVCVISIIACCCCAVCRASTTESTRRTVINTGYAPVPVVAKTY